MSIDVKVNTTKDGSTIKVTAGDLSILVQHRVSLYCTNVMKVYKKEKNSKDYDKKPDVVIID